MHYEMPLASTRMKYRATLKFLIFPIAQCFLQQQCELHGASFHGFRKFPEPLTVIDIFVVIERDHGNS